MQEEKFFYQPSMVSSVIIWSWTTMILLLGIVVWLEITHFQIYTALLFAIFILLTCGQIFRRTLKVTPDTVTFSRLLQKDYLTIPRTNIQQLQFMKNSLRFNIGGQTYNYTFSRRSLAIIKQLLSDH